MTRLSETGKQSPLLFLSLSKKPMIRFSEHYNLFLHNTFGVSATTRYFFEFTEPEDLPGFIQSNTPWKELPILVLGGGSNLLFITDFNGVIIHPNVPGITPVKEDRRHIWIEVGAGEVWDDFVQYCVDRDYGGAENLSLIPGRVGAAPVQNIGAYGQEAGNLIESVKGYDLQENQWLELHGKACGFSYRESIFKQQLKNRFVVTSVLFRMEKYPEFNLQYGQLEEQVRYMGDVNLTNIRKAVISIRNSKLPKVSELGNAGSFFKNPVVERSVAKKISDQFPEAPFYPVSEGEVKLAAGWLIEKAGWRGRREGNVGMHENQALVLVNYGNATGREIFLFSEKIALSVFEKFGVRLEREVNCIGSVES